MLKLVKGTSPEGNLSPQEKAVGPKVQAPLSPAEDPLYWLEVVNKKSPLAQHHQHHPEEALGHQNGARRMQDLIKACKHGA